MKRILLFCLMSLSTLHIKAQCWKEVSAGWFYNAGIKTDGTLWIWGNFNVPGVGVIVNSLVPVQVGTATNWKTLSANCTNFMAIQTNGTLWGMGNNFFGQLGNGTTVGTNTLVQIGTATNWASVSAGQGHTIALKTNGTLWSWGDNPNGQLGDGTTIGRTSPAQIGTDADWQSISTTDHFTGMAIKANGTLWCWGSDANSGIGTNLGLGTGIFIRILPTQVGTDSDWQSVSVGYNHTLAIKTGGTLWACGVNVYGELGDGTNNPSSVFIQIGAATDWKNISASNMFEYSLGLKTSGTLWSWGGNIGGQLGNNTNINSNVPGQVGVATTWQSISAGTVHSLAIRTDGSLWGWGVGGLGDGTNIGKNYPVEILSPIVTINASATNICAGSPITLSGAGASTYTWTGGVTDGVPFVPSSSGTYTVTGTDAHGCYNTATVNITIAPPSTVTATASSTTVCSGGTVTLNGSGGSSYVWSNGVTDGLAFTPTATSTYTVVDGAGCSNTASITVNVIASPTVVINASSTNVCAGTSVTLSASGASTYTWTGGVSNGTPFVPAASAMYTVTGSNGGICNHQASVGITVTPNTTVTANATSTNVCIGGTVTLTGSGGSSYIWSNGVSNGVSFTPVATATYTVTNNSICSNTISITVSVLPLPVVTVNNATICAGTNALLTASVNPVSGTTYNWSSASTSNSLTVSPTVNTSYTITATNSGCSASAVASVTVIPVNVPVTGFSYPTPLCLTTSNPLPTGVSGFSPGGTYSSGAGITTDPASGLIDLSNSNAGTYVITYSVAVNGCNPSASSTTTITLNAPTAAVTGFSYLPVCSNDANPSPVLNPNFTTGGNFSGSGLTVNTTNGVIDLSGSPSGSYVVTYNVNAANCVLAGSGTATVVINPTPLLSMSSSTLIYAGDQTTLTANSSANSYTWSPASGLTCSDCASPVASPNESTTYCVRTSDGVCANSACLTVIVESLCEGDKGFFLPNAFSPNGDGNNDVFCVQGRTRCISNFQMIIYDRWGEKMFESSDLSFCWDGTYRGKPLVPDVFMYYIKAQDQNQKELIKKGNISLIK
jgi:gliding motility-associated-like protein